MGCGSSSTSRDIEPLSAKENTRLVHIEKGTNVKLRPHSNNIVFVFGEITTIRIV